MGHGHVQKPDDKDKSELDPKQEHAKEGGAGEKKNEGGDGGHEQGAQPAAGGAGVAESWAPPTIDVHTPTSGDSYALKGSIAVNFDVGSQQATAKEKSQHCQAHFTILREGKVIHSAAMEETLKDGHARDVFALDSSILGGPGKVELHYWASDYKGVESTIKKIQFEVVDEGKQEAAPEGQAGQAADPNQPGAPG